MYIFKEIRPLFLSFFFPPPFSFPRCNTPGYDVCYQWLQINIFPGLSLCLQSLHRTIPFSPKADLMDRMQPLLAKHAAPELDPFLQAAARAALTAGSILKELYDRPHTITMKGEINLVTEADVAAEVAIIASLQEDAPGIAVMAEESTAENPTDPKDRVWIVDPLDGTTNFAHGFPFFAVSIALLEHGKPLVGAIYCPLQNELFYCRKGGGAWLNGKQIQVTNTDLLIRPWWLQDFPMTSMHE